MTGQVLDNQPSRTAAPASREYPELFVRLDALLHSSKPYILAAIDGNSGAGKSWLADRIASVYECNVIHADDFFLQPEQRTPERLSEPGGNVDYERLESEVYSQIAKGVPFEYRRFDCSVMGFGDAVTVAPRRLTVIEGSYSLHPNLSAYCDLKIFLKISAESQVQRILQRNGPVMVQRFEREWIPKENLYFSTFHIEENCDLVFTA